MTGSERRNKASTIKDYESRLLRVLDHIDQHLDQDLNLDDLAAIAFFSRFHFHRIFRGMTGETLGGYIRRRRLELAAQRLLESEESVTNLAFDAKFENAESFSRAFKSRFGLTPSHFRRAGKPIMTIPAVQTARLGQLSSQAQALAIYMETEGRKSMFDVEIKQFPPSRLACVSHQGPYNEIGKAFENLCCEAAKQSLFGAAPQILALYYDDPHTVPADQLRSDAALGVASDANISGPLEEKHLNEGSYAVATYKGPYSGLQAAYDWLYGQWLPQSGREAADKPSVELYLNDPTNTKQEDLLTEIRVPLA